MTDITITPWKRFGHDRGYATAVEGTKLGWIDVNTGVVTIEEGADAVAVTVALETWRATVGKAAPATEVRTAVAPPVTEQGVRDSDAAPDIPSPQAVPVAVVPATPPLAPRIIGDLALQRPGEAVKAKALEERDAYTAARPVASRVARFLQWDTPERSWERGARGEAIVGARLEKLVPQGWRVLHAVPIGKRGSDIDHLLIGPGGVYCINTKNHENSNVWVGEKMIMVNGQKTDHLRNSRYEAKRVSKILTEATGWSIETIPTLVIMAKNYTVKRSPQDVTVIGRREVPKWFGRLQPTLSAEAVEAIYNAARQPHIWVP